MKCSKVVACLVLFYSICCNICFAQTGIGFRFGSDINSFNNSGAYPLVQGQFSNLVLGGYYKKYKRTGGAEIGLNLILKNANGANIPLLMSDFGASQNTSITAFEIDFKIGPRFGYFYPKLGVLAGYRSNAQGFLLSTAPPEYRINPYYITIPIGLTIELPTRWGAVGLSGFYKIGLTNFILNPDGRSNWDGATLRAVNFELHYTFGQPPL